MRYKQWLNKWSGVILVLIISINIIWLFCEGKLNWYIHPRYEIFAVVFAVLGICLSIVALAMRPTESHLHSLRRREWMGQGVLVLVAVVFALVIAPATLTAITATQRVVNSGALTTGSARESSILKERGDYINFTIKDWASLLSQSNDPSLYEHKPVKVSGFVTPSGDDDVYFVSRFLVTCCAVDARPIGVPVYDPGWRDKISPDQWIEVSGVFSAHPHQSQENRTVVIPSHTQKIQQEDNPYVH